MSIRSSRPTKGTSRPGSTSWRERLAALLGVRELLEGHRHERPIAELCQGAEGLAAVALLEVEDDVDVVGEADEAVGDDGEAPGHQVANAGLVEAAEDLLDAEGYHAGPQRVAGC